MSTYYEDPQNNASAWDDFINNEAQTKPVANSPKVKNSFGDNESIVRIAARQIGLDENLAVAVMSQESRGKTNATSPKGASGLMQVMPGTFKQMGGDMSKIYDPQENARIGTAYLKKMLDDYDGDIPAALAAYNAGPGRVQKFGRDVTKWNGFKETKNYVPSVMARYEKLAGVQPSSNASLSQSSNAWDDFVANEPNGNTVSPSLASNTRPKTTPSLSPGGFNYTGAPLDLNLGKVDSKPKTIADRIANTPTQASQPTKKLSIGDLRAMENAEKPRSIGDLKVVENRELPQAKALARKAKADKLTLADQAKGVVAGALDALPYLDPTNKTGGMFSPMSIVPPVSRANEFQDNTGYEVGRIAGNLAETIGASAVLGPVAGTSLTMGKQSLVSNLEQQAQNNEDISLTEAGKETLKGATKGAIFGQASKLPFVNQAVSKIAGGAGAGTTRAVAGALARPVLTGVENVATSVPVDIGVDAAYDLVTGDDSLARNQYLTDPANAVKRDLLMGGVLGTGFNLPAAAKGYRTSGIQEGVRNLGTGGYVPPAPSSEPQFIIASNDGRLAEAYEGVNGLEYREVPKLSREQLLDLTINSKVPIETVSKQAFDQRLAGFSDVAPETLPLDAQPQPTEPVLETSAKLDIEPATKQPTQEIKSSPLTMGQRAEELQAQGYSPSKVLAMLNEEFGQPVQNIAKANNQLNEVSNESQLAEPQPTKIQPTKPQASEPVKLTAKEQPSVATSAQKEVYPVEVQAKLDAAKARHAQLIQQADNYSGGDKQYASKRKSQAGFEYSKQKKQILAEYEQSKAQQPQPQVVAQSEQAKVVDQGNPQQIEQVKPIEAQQVSKLPELPNKLTMTDLRTEFIKHGFKDENGHVMKDAKRVEEHATELSYVSEALFRSTGKTADQFVGEFIKEVKSSQGKAGNKGATQFVKGGQAVLHLFKDADASTIPHEVMHIFRPHLTPDEQGTIGTWLESRGVGKPQNGKWTPAQEEMLARGFENWLVTGKLPEGAPTRLQEAFGKVKGWVGAIYKKLEGTPIPISKGIKRLFSDTQFDAPTAKIFEDRLTMGARGLEADALVAESKETAQPIVTKPAELAERAAIGESSEFSKPLSEVLQADEYSKITNKEAIEKVGSLIAKNYDEALALAQNPEIEQGKAYLQNALGLELLRDAQAKGERSKVNIIVKAMGARAVGAGQSAQVLANIARIAPDSVSQYVESLMLKEGQKISEGLRDKAENVTSVLFDKVDNTPEQLSLLFQKATGAPKPMLDKLTDALGQAKTSLDREQVIREFVGKRYGVPTLTAEATTNITKMAKDLQGKTGYERQEAIALLGKYIGEQVPQGWGKKLKFLLRVSDLLNPGGALLNTASDLAFSSPIGLESIASKVAAGLDSLAVKTGLAKERSIVSSQKQKGEYWNNIKLSAKEIAKGIDTSQALDDRFETGLTPAFKGKWAEIADKGVKLGYGLTQNASYRTIKAESIRNQMKVAAINGKALSEPTTEMIKRAEKEALDKTLSDSNVITESLSTIQQTLNKLSTAGKSSEIGIGTASITYTKVPGNLLKKGVEFSPLGLGKVLKEMVQHERYKMSGGAKGKEIDQREFVQSLARVLVGTVGAVGLGALLHRAGVLVKDSSESNERKLQQLQNETGVAGYKINVNAGARWAKTGLTDVSVTTAKQGDWLVKYDFLQPHGFLLSLGANLDETLGKTYSYLRGQDSETSVLDLISQYTDNGLEPLTDVAIIQSLRKAGQLSDLADQNKQGSYAKNLTGNLLTRPFPAVMRQLRNYFDNTKRETNDPNSFVNTLVNKTKDNVPALSKTLPAQKTTFGEDKQRIIGNDGTITSAIDSFVLGGRLTNYKTDPETKYLIDLFQARAGSDKQGSHIPAIPREFDIDGKKVQPSPIEKAKYQDLVGHATRDLVQRVNSISKFKELSPDGQGEFIASYLKEIGQAAKSEVFNTKSERKQAALKNVLPKSEAVFDHNITVRIEEEKIVKALDTDPQLRKLYNKLSDAQKEHANNTIRLLFTKLQVREKPKATTKEIEIDLQEKRIGLKTILMNVREKLVKATNYDPNKE